VSAGLTIRLAASLAGMACAGLAASNGPPDAGAAEAPQNPEAAADASAAELYLVPPYVEYPREARMRGMSGRCEVLFRVDAQGVPQAIQPTCSSRFFEAAAARAIYRARLNMAADGIAPGVWLKLPLEFRIETAAPPPEG
jgi:TonB family protein